VTRDLGRFERGLEDSDGATVRTVQVVSVDRVRTRRVVTLKIAYDDEDETTVFERWLLFPRAIYMCDSNCFELFDDLSKLLEYVQQEEPLFRLPLRPGERWGDITVIGVEDVTVPMGKFDGVLDLQLSARAGQFDPALFYPQRLFLKPGVGIIKRNVERSSRPIEALIEYRLMH
jgi:hypothetical protein